MLARVIYSLISALRGLIPRNQDKGHFLYNTSTYPTPTPFSTFLTSTLLFYILLLLSSPFALITSLHSFYFSKAWEKVLRQSTPAFSQEQCRRKGVP